MKSITDFYLENMNYLLKEDNLVLSNIRPLSKRIIHSNPIYICNLEDKYKKGVIKFHKSREIMQKEIICNNYLSKKGLSVPKIISFSESPIPHIVMEKISGKDLSSRDISNRTKDLANIHALSFKDSGLNKKLKKLTKEERIKDLNENIKILRFNSFIDKIYIKKFILLSKLLKKIDYAKWEQCFCFNDFFVNNSMKSKGRLYYFDFEKAVISSPFVDVGCIIINYPKKYYQIKSIYIENITKLIKNNSDGLDLFIDSGVCEKVIEDAAFLSNDSIKKTKTNNFCKKLAKRKIESVSFIFDNLKNSFMGEK